MSAAEQSSALQFFYLGILASKQAFVSDIALARLYALLKDATWAFEHSPDIQLDAVNVDRWVRHFQCRYPEADEYSWQYYSLGLIMAPHLAKPDDNNWTAYPLLQSECETYCIALFDCMSNREGPLLDRRFHLV